MDPSSNNRVVVLVDMDCFYVQVEQKLNPEYHNKPCAVVQYNTWKGGGIIAVNYEARAYGVKRGMRGDEAKRKCPEIHLFHVPEVRGKADLTRYREAGASVLEVLCEFSDCVERASIDEAFLDMTAIVTEKIKNSSSVTSNELPNTFIVGWEKEDSSETSNLTDVEAWLHSIYEEEHMLNEQMLAIAAAVTEKMRAAVFEKTKFRCSAGISFNKMLAKLACGIHKPNKQTVLPFSSVSFVYSTLPVHKVRNLGGKLGEEIVEKLGVKTMGDLMSKSEAQLHSHFGEKTGSWLYNVSRGLDYEPVVARQLPKSIGCGKNFPGKSALNTIAKVTHWLQQLATELEERLRKDQHDNRRIAKSLTVTIRCQGDSSANIISRTCPIRIYNAHKLASDVLFMLQKLNSASVSSLMWKPPILSLAMSASKFEDALDTSMCNIANYFSAKTSPTKCTESAVIKEKLVLTVEEEEGSNVNETNCSGREDVGKISCYFSSTKIEFLNQQHDVSKPSTSANNMQAPLDDLNYLADIIEEENNKDQNSNTLNDKSSAAVSNEINIVESPNATELEQQVEKKSDSGLDKYSQVNKPVIGFFARKLMEKQSANSLNFKEKSAECSSSENFKNQSASSDNHLTDHLDVNCSIQNEKTENKAIKNGIKSFFQRNASKELSHSSDTDDLKQKMVAEISKTCEKCQKTFLVWEEQEHLDYHLAVEMQKEINAIKPILPGEKTAKTKTGIKKKNASKKNSALLTKKQKVNTLDSFLK